MTVLSLSARHRAKHFSWIVPTDLAQQPYKVRMATAGLYT